MKGQRSRVEVWSIHSCRVHGHSCVSDHVWIRFLFLSLSLTHTLPCIHTIALKGINHSETFAAKQRA